MTDDSVWVERWIILITKTVIWPVFDSDSDDNDDNSGGRKGELYLLPK